LAAATGAELCLHEAAGAAYPFRALRDGDVLPLGALRLEVLHTPGHRPELISLVVVNPARSPEPSMVLTADSLLVGDVGRPDFGGGDPAAQYASVQRLLALPDYVGVFPGHFEGPCGKGMCGRPSTTVGFERRFNPMLQLDGPAFVDTLTRDVPARPLNMTAIEATNRGTADLPWAMPRGGAVVEEVGPDAVIAAGGGAFVLDVREPAEYALGHLPGAVNVPQADLATRLAEVPRDRPLLVVCQAGARSRRAAQFLAGRGYDRVRSVAGGTTAWQAAGHALEAALRTPGPGAVVAVRGGGR
jgi:rhodanese-related sulfurtransferase